MKPEKILKALKHHYPDAHCALIHENPFQLLVATVLSAQCTDKRVNLVTPGLFEKFPTPQSMSKAKISELEDLIRTTGMYKTKARALSELSQKLMADFGGTVPATMEDLRSLRGVGRKTANVVLGNAFGINEGIVVDTHVGRISQRLSLTREKTPEKIEAALVKLIPKKDWTIFSHLLIHHGRSLCKARSPLCDVCFLRPYCPFKK